MYCSIIYIMCVCFESEYFINTYICRREGERERIITSLLTLQGSDRWGISRVCFPCVDYIINICLNHMLSRFGFGELCFSLRLEFELKSTEPLIL